MLTNLSFFQSVSYIFYFMIPQLCMSNVKILKIDQPPILTNVYIGNKKVTIYLFHFLCGQLSIRK